MQVSKAAVVATGALAAAAAMGSTPAFAADGEGTPAVTPATVGLIDYEGKHRASDEAMRELAEQWLTVAPEQTWSAPWEQEPSQIVSVGSGSAFSVAPFQQCGSHGPLALGLAVPISSPATVVGDCDNGNVDVANGGGDEDVLFSILDGTAVSALAIQQCGSGAAIGGVTAPIDSPATVIGDCDNGNITVGDRPDDPDDPYYPLGVDDTKRGGSPAPATDSGRAEQTIVPREAPWEADRDQVLSVASGAAVSALAFQQCGSHGPLLGGVTAPISSPATVMGDCTNANIDVNGDPGDSLFSVLDRSAISVAPIQQCGSGVGIAGVGAPIDSPATVSGDCKNGNISVR